MKMENRVFGRLLPDEERKLREFLDEHAFLFDDMLFRPGSCTYNAAVLTYEDGVTDDEFYLPEALLSFSFSYFDVSVEHLEDCCGYYNSEEQKLVIDPDHYKESTILHEMIHLHEDILLEEAPYYRDCVFFALYKSLQKNIPDLDEILEEYSHLSIMMRSYGTASAGLHSVVFLLKSFQIDIHYSWKLGTTFGYGQDEIFGQYQYTK